MDLQADILRRQLAFANALRGQEAPRHTTGAGGAFGALGAVLGGIGSGLRAREAEGRLDALAKLRSTAVSPGQRLALALQKAQLAKTEREAAEAKRLQEIDAAPVSPEMVGLLGRIGVKARPDMQTREANALFGMAEKAYAAEQRARELQLNRAAMSQARTDAAAARDEDKILDRTNKLATKVETSAPVVASLETIAGLLGPEGFETKENIAGIGRGQGLLVGPLSLLRSDKGKEMRAAAADLSANVLRAYSGAAASDRELSRTLERLGQGDFSDDKEFLGALKRVRNFVALQMKQAEAGVGSEAARRFESEGGVSSRRATGIGVPAGAQSLTAGGPPQVKSAEEYAALPSGAEYIDPNGKRKRKR